MKYNDFQENYENYINSFYTFEKNINDFKIREKEIIESYKSEIIKLEIEKKSTLDAVNDIYKKNTDALEDKRKKLQGEINRYHLIFEKGDTNYGKITPEIDNRIQELRIAINEFINDHLNKIEKANNDKINLLNSGFNQTRNEIDNQFDISKEELANNANVCFQNACQKEINFFNDHLSTIDFSKFINDISVFNDSGMNAYSQIGSIEINLNLFDNYKINKEFKVIVPFIDKKSILIIHDEKNAQPAENIHDTLVTRSFLSFGVGNLKMNFFDLKGMGDFFKEFTPINHKIVNVGFGRNKLEELLKQIEEANQKIALSYTSSSKSSSFNSLGLYNFDKITSKNFDNIIPQTLTVILNISYDADESMIRNLKRLIKNSNVNGTQFILTWDVSNENEKNKDLLKELVDFSELTTIDLVSNRSNYNLQNYSLKTFNLPEFKKHEFVSSINEEFEAKSKTITKVNFKDTLPEKLNWFSQSAKSKINVPVGVSKSHRGVQDITFYTNEPLSHALLSGGTGSGKTNFLKTFITSLSVRYSPEELELYLIDLKNGAGFYNFKKNGLPHVKMYAFGAENELILNMLSTLVDELNYRYNTFRPLENLEQVREKRPDVLLRRIVLIIDEFSTIFYDDNPYQDEICNKLYVIASKGRAMGINMLISTQNFNAVSHSFNKSKSEMPIRVLLKSSDDAANAIIDSRNDGNKFIRTVGDGLINYYHGNLRQEGDNEYFKGYLLDNDDLDKILFDLNEQTQKQGYDSNSQVVYNNIVEADFSQNDLIFKQERKVEIQNENGTIEFIPSVNRKIPIWLGEPTVISETHFKIDLDRNHSENILISGIIKEVSIQSIFNVISSLLYSVAEGDAAFRFISFLGEEENLQFKFDCINKISKGFDFQFFDENNYAECLIQLSGETTFRYENNLGKSKKVFLFVVGLENAKKIYADGFLLSEQGQLLSEILERGPRFNIHTICEVRSPSNLRRILKETGFGFFKHRIVYHLGNADESNMILDAKYASSLYRQDEPHTKNRAYYYNADFEKVYHKFKPYANLLDGEKFFPDNFGKHIFEEKIFLFEPKKNINETDSKTLSNDSEKKEKEKTITNELIIEKSLWEDLDLDGDDNFEININDL